MSRNSVWIPESHSTPLPERIRSSHTMPNMSEKNVNHGTLLERTSHQWWGNWGRRLTRICCTRKGSPTTTKVSSSDEETALDSDPCKYGQDQNEQLKKQLLMSLCKCLMLYGAPCHRIEQSLEKAAQSLDINATFIYIPGVMIIYIGGEQPQTLLVRCPQGFDMGKLALVNGVANQVCKGHQNPQDCIRQLDSIFESPPTWGPWILLVAHTLSSLLTVPVMFNGSLIDTALGGALGFIVGVLSFFAEKHSSYCNIFEISTSVAVAIIAKSLDQWICFTAVILSATVIMLPGYTLTMSIMELSARHIITGTVRFVYSLIYTLFIGYGLEIGTSIYNAVQPSGSQSDFDTCNGRVPHWLNLLLFPFVAVSMAMTLGATVRQWPSMICCSAIGFGTSMIAGKVIANYQIVATLSAFCVGLFGNLYLKVTGDLALVPLSCGIVSLVPGSVGVQGAYFLVRQDDQGISFAIEMVVASLSIAVGLLAATLVVYPTGKKRCIYLTY